jgi:hypothetical protein
MHASTPDSGSIIVLAVLVVTRTYCAAREECRLCIGPDFINMLPSVVDQSSPGFSLETTVTTVIVV